MVILDMEDMIQENHLLRKIETVADFYCIHEEAKEYYSLTGHQSIDPG